jgi:hypothetical protein
VQDPFETEMEFGEVWSGAGFGWLSWQLQYIYHGF